MQAHAEDIYVPAGAVEAVELRPGEVLVSLEGVVWATSSDRASDVLLIPGEAMQFPRRARAVVGGLRGRSVKVRRAPANEH